MFYQLLFIHLYRPFLRYTKSTSPLPQHVSPRRLCTQAASAISKLLRIYKRSYGLRQICNIAVYFVHSACTIHLLNLPDRNAKRDLVHGLRNLEEIAEGWLCARRTLRILDISASKWHIDLPSEAIAVFERAYAKWGSWGAWDHGSSPVTSEESPTMGKSGLSSTDVTGRSTPADFPTSMQQQQYAAKPPDSRVPITSTAPPFQPPFFPNVSHLYATGLDRRSYGNYPQTSRPEPGYLQQGPQMAFPQTNSMRQPQPQDMWNVGQDIPCNNSNSSNSPGPVTGTPPMPVFNVVSDTAATEDIQEWWLRDQSSFALGMENWGEGWAGNHFDMDQGIGEIPVPQQPRHDPSSSMPPQPQGKISSTDLQVRAGSGTVETGYGYSENLHSGY
jgi:hypothetical protein